MRLKWTFWDILGYVGTFKDILGHHETFWDNFEDFTTSLEHLDRFPSHLTIFSHNQLIEKNALRTDRPSYRDAWTHLKNKFVYTTIALAILSLPADESVTDRPTNRWTDTPSYRVVAHD